ncbi:transposition protein [Rhodovulum sulfidophilum]|uniref:Transposition protein n=1 Tax=Rhodovulum sulfidophilum TaxID=35806 RepID=A0A0D6B5F2_RHOSU|nr:transposition protein [Rhodovulum sulfidophilum]
MLRFVGQVLLRALGDPTAADRRARDLWTPVRHHLRERRVLVVHWDRAQDLASRGARHGGG